MTEQTRLDLATRPAVGREDFIVTESNALAVAIVDGWRSWAGRKLILAGPEGSGKSHLAQAWATESGATVIAAASLAQSDIPALATGCVVVEDVDDLNHQRPAEEALFHLHNLVLAEGHALMLTAQRPPKLWRLDLPDLQSRMQGTQVVQLGAPDDLLLASVLERLLKARLIVPKPDVLPYLVAHMDRSFAMAARLAEALDQESMDQGCEVTRIFARNVLLRLQAES